MAVTADDFLDGFNEDYENDSPTQTYPPQQTTNRFSKPLPVNSARRNQNNRGIMAVTADDFLDGFNEDYENETTNKDFSSETTGNGNDSSYTSFGPAWAQQMADRYKPNQNTAAGPVAQWQTQKQKEFEEDHAGFSPLKAFGGAVEKGLQGIAQAGGDLLAFGEDILWSPIEFFAALEPGTISDNAIFNQWANKIRENGEEIDAKHAENVAAGGNTGEFIYNMGAATVQAAPQAVMAMLTSGTSLAAQTTAGLQTTANTALSPGVVTTVKDIVGNMARDPQYWLAFSQTVGTSYQNAVTMLEEKSLSDEISGRGEAMSQGEIRTKAALYALGTGLMNAAVERSGGLQTLPEELQHGGDVWEMIVNSGVSEGKEETLQGILDRAMQKLMLGKDYKLMSFTDKNAVFSLPAAAEEFGTGAFVGGLLSGGQALTHGIMNPAKYAVNIDGDVESVQPLPERDIITTTELWMQQLYDAVGIQSGEVQMVNMEGNQTANENFGITDVAPTNIEQRKPFDVQPTHSQTLSKTRMNSLSNDIKANGIREPIKCVQYDGQLYVVDGHHRLLIAKRMGLTEVPVEIVELPYAGYNTVDDLLWFD